MARVFIFRKFFSQIKTMDTEEFRRYGKEMIDYICEYLESIPNRRVTPTVSPGWLKNEIPATAPFHPEPFDDIMKDVEGKIMPGVSTVLFEFISFRSNISAKNNRYH